MKQLKKLSGLLTTCLLLSFFISELAFASDPLASWNEGPTKQAIINFVDKVKQKNSKDYVPPSERIAVFDNDGTLWIEQPMYVQLAFALDRVKELTPKHPEWKSQQPFKAVLEGDMKTLEILGEKGIAELVMTTHAGMTNEEFENIVSKWIATAHHPRFKVAYTDLVYVPMVELLTYLRANDFKTFIVSGGGIEFMRPWANKAYGIPPEQVVGSSIKLKYEHRDGKPIMLRLPAVNFIDDKEGKPIGIESHIGLRPIAAFGNSDGDYQMLEWTTAGSGPRLGMIVHHDDAKREYAYDRKSAVGKLDKALDAAPSHGWILINMKEDWKRVFASDK